MDGSKYSSSLHFEVPNEQRNWVNIFGCFVVELDEFEAEVERELVRFQWNQNSISRRYFLRD